MEEKRDFKVSQNRQQPEPAQQQGQRRGIFTGRQPLYGASEPQVNSCPDPNLPQLAVHVADQDLLSMACLKADRPFWR